jgi:hypothetical protein
MQTNYIQAKYEFDYLPNITGCAFLDIGCILYGMVN